VAEHDVPARSGPRVESLHELSDLASKPTLRGSELVAKGPPLMRSHLVKRTVDFRPRHALGQPLLGSALLACASRGGISGCRGIARPDDVGSKPDLAWHAASPPASSSFDSRRERAVPPHPPLRNDDAPCAAETRQKAVGNTKWLIICIVVQRSADDALTHMHARTSETADANELGPYVSSYLEFHRRDLLKLLDRPGSSGVAFATRHSKIMDGLLTTLFAAALAKVGASFRTVPVVLGAVGGYGRGLLGFKSDLDLRLVTDEAPESIQPLAEALLYPLWNLGVSVGHQVTSVSELIEGARQDLPTATCLLDMRVLAGDASIAKRLEERAYSGIFSEGELPLFMERLQDELHARHRRFGDSVYLLEPDVKSGAGGLRDLNIAFWAGRARFRVANSVDFRRVGVVSSQEGADLEDATDFLWTLRNHLHRHANRRSDRLTFDEQETIAKSLGYHERASPGTGASADEVTGVAVEALMSDYYRHARVILRVREQIIARSTPSIGRARRRVEDLGGGLQSFNGQITFAHTNEIDGDPALVLRIFATAVDRHTTILPFARDHIVRATSKPDFCEALRMSDEAAALFIQLVATQQESAFRNNSILSELHDVGLLTAMIPEFQPVVGRVHHDIYHVYTVDVHSVAAVDHLHALSRGVLAGDQPLASRVAAEVTNREVLLLATLLHDVGKAIGGRDHSRRGADMARVILTRLGLPPSDVDAACHLIVQHLTMYRVAVSRDLEDPATVAAFAPEVLGPEGLRHLYLLTTADLSTTSPTSITKWKAGMLDELFLATDAFLSGRSPSDPERLSLLRAEVKKHWPECEDFAFVDEYLGSMPERYLLSNTPHEIAAHARVALRSRGHVVMAEIVPSRLENVTELCVVTGDGAREGPVFIVARDRPGLLAAIAAAIGGNNLEVHAAQIYTRKLPDGSEQAVDLFWVTRRGDDDDGAAVIAKLQRDLESVIQGTLTPGELVKRRGTNRWSDRPSPPVSTEVAIDNRASARHTLIEVVARDRPGLLFTVSQALHEIGITISTAKINTEGTRAIDVFYVTELDGRKLDGEARASGVRQHLLAAVGARTPANAGAPAAR